MQLNKENIQNNEIWEEEGYILPKFNRMDMIENTKKNPIWIHFGAGNIFRAFHANIAQNLLNKNEMQQGIIVAEGFDYEIIKKMYQPHDDYSILVTLKANGTIDKTIIGSVAESLELNSENEKDFKRLQQIFVSKSLQMATFTITEKGYSLYNNQKQFLSDVAFDFTHGPSSPRSYMGKITSLLYTRFEKGSFPIALVSTDNCSHNGDKLHDAILTIAKKWVANKQVSPAFIEYITNPKQVSFPWTMIDKITPRPNKNVENILKRDGIDDLESIITSKNTYVAPFVNAEECEYLVIEDVFPNGRPRLEDVGVLFTNKETVDKVERMKVCTCLNPLHTALAIFGCLLGYNRIYEEMKDEDLRKLIEHIGYQEGLPVVTNPNIMNPKDFIDTVIHTRLCNPFMPDTPQRIATDTSQKLSIRFGETIKAYMKSNILNVSDLKYIPLVLAGWIRYLMAMDDEGNTFELSPDPMLKDLLPILKPIQIHTSCDIEKILRPILKNEQIFGVDLYEIQMAPLVCQYFKEMIQGQHAVRNTIHKYV